MYKQSITKMIITARKNNEFLKAEVLKSLKTAFLNYETAKNAKRLDDAVEINIIKKMRDSLKETIPVFKKNNREDLVESYSKQVKYLDSLLPAAPSKEDIAEYIITTYPEGIEKKQMGKIIKEIKNKWPAADGKTVADMVKTQLK